MREEEVVVLSEGKVCATFKKGEHIFTQGDTPKGIFIINLGKVLIARLADNGNEQVIKMANSGDIIGYRALLSNEIYSSTATAIETTDVCFLPRHLFFSYLEHNVTIAGALLKIASEDLKKSERKIVDLNQKSAKERIAEALLYIKEIYGVESDGATLSATLSRGDIANIAGTTRETSIRVLAELHHKGIIDFIGKSIRICDFQSLVTLANVSE